ncbi:gastrula zinc finger protein xFG20-1-like [Mizuhopecten yessoensis]|uniref:gastrula zinc finger protein xFG20-1-like n=1 Tax=Mizuhopecten yessoensis TaxID=6573 RepID=UPI000B45A929|nr:gastrula zinc finger protein xFG20-1-like [Mizuhopecten yessoensis]XP_021364390.1 gastrula zinc finger protein xFG20-1-like [Mizuhopecten yessoensis]XP_021364391.1 gastrula zinc finger protein xFG20-1-like [Mizuhopecten yessoensis]
MSNKEKDLVARLLKQSILTLCKETVSFNHNLEVDGIISITLENESQQIVIKVHEYFQKIRDESALPNADNFSEEDGSIERYEKQPRVTNIIQRKGYSETFRPQQLSAGDAAPSNRLRSPNSGKFTKTVQKAWPDGYSVADSSLPPSGDDDLSPQEEPSSMSSSNDFGSAPVDSDLDDMDDDYDEDEKKFDPRQQSATKSLTSGHGVPMRKPIVHRLMAQKLVANARRNPKINTTSRSLTGENPKVANLNTAVNTTGTSVSSLPAKNIRCKRCGEVASDGPAFVHHNLNVHNVFTCQICYNTFTCRNNMKRHIRLHTGYKPYQCSLCSESFTRKDDIKRHLIRHNYSKPFRCNLCGKGYMDRKTIKTHMRKEHLRKLVHVCPTCGESFDDDQKFQIHKKEHPELKVFQCSVCHFTGSNSLMYNKHLLTHDPSRTFPCKACDLDFNDPFKYTNHVKRHRYETNFRLYNCCFCRQICSTYDQFIKHEHTHAQAKRHTCTICLKQFRYPSNLREHMVTHSNYFMHGAKEENAAINSNNRSPEVQNTISKQEVTALCIDQEDVEYTSEFIKGEETLPADSSSQYWCTECQQGFETEDMLTEHITRTHEMSMDETSPNSDDGNPNKRTKVEACTSLDICTPNADPTDLVTSSGYPTNPVVATGQTSLLTTLTNPSCRKTTVRVKLGDSSYRSVVVKQEPDSDSDGASGDHRHSPDHFSIASPHSSSTSQHEQMDNGPVFPQNGDLEKKLVIQPAPIKLSVRSPGFERVVTPVSLFKNEESFTCDVCSDVSTDFESYDKHNNTMHRRFLCEYCGKTFTSKPNRDRHVRYHTGERPFKCELCSKSFFRGDDLKYHRTTRHAEVKPFSCTKCVMTFAWHNDLERHLKTHRT